MPTSSVVPWTMALVESVVERFSWRTPPGCTVFNISRRAWFTEASRSAGSVRTLTCAATPASFSATASVCVPPTSMPRYMGSAPLVVDPGQTGPGEKTDVAPPGKGRKGPPRKHFGGRSVGVGGWSGEGRAAIGKGAAERGHDRKGSGGRAHPVAPQPGPPPLRQKPWSRFPRSGASDLAPFWLRKSWRHGLLSGFCLCCAWLLSLLSTLCSNTARGFQRCG